jgi:hypothetical protein
MLNFSGQIDEVVPSLRGSAGGHIWRIRMRRQPGIRLPSDGSISIYRDLFEEADVQADVTEPEERQETGMTWTFTIRQAGVVTTLTVYK